MLMFDDVLRMPAEHRPMRASRDPAVLPLKVQFSARGLVSAARFSVPPPEKLPLKLSSAAPRLLASCADAGKSSMQIGTERQADLNNIVRSSGWH
jgi:hypothetical protein